VCVEALVGERPQFGGTCAGLSGFEAAELRLYCGRDVPMYHFAHCPH
jgi:hypothetical protein